MNAMIALAVLVLVGALLAFANAPMLVDVPQGQQEERIDHVR